MEESPMSETEGELPFQDRVPDQRMAESFKALASVDMQLGPSEGIVQGQTTSNPSATVVEIGPSPSDITSLGKETNKTEEESPGFGPWTKAPSRRRRVNNGKAQKAIIGQQSNKFEVLHEEQSQAESQKAQLRQEIQGPSPSRNENNFRYKARAHDPKERRLRNGAGSTSAKDKTKEEIWRGKKPMNESLSKTESVIRKFEKKVVRSQMLELETSHLLTPPNHPIPTPTFKPNSTSITHTSINPNPEVIHTPASQNKTVTCEPPDKDGKDKRPTTQ
ncbi:hypothetical protein LOK49_LG07G00812 [Camellia lanceoleosa]|uniref:Uncharacterized protein n=1 Tax=Camellia lanceoleosa TaxID=1840588 RepID=A0ACC0H7E4_9ERIC|nr:hypothetical protein LOK49_LG07G00812 [Camellia lanceoleosa]